MTTPQPLFSLGTVVATPGALAALAQAGQSPHELLQRHVTGDWGDLDADDKDANERALRDGSRLFSAYRLTTGEKLWAITEAENDGHRASTCLLLPDEY